MTINSLESCVIGLSLNEIKQEPYIRIYPERSPACDFGELFAVGKQRPTWCRYVYAVIDCMYGGTNSLF